MGFNYDSIGLYEVVNSQNSGLNQKKVLAFTANIGDVKQTPEQYADNTGEYFVKDVFGLNGGGATYMTLKGQSSPITTVENTYQRAYLSNNVESRDGLPCNCRVLFTPFNVLLAWSSGTSFTEGTTYVAVKGQPINNSKDFVIYHVNETLQDFYDNLIGD